jgi:hypothetical protein
MSQHESPLYGFYEQIDPNKRFVKMADAVLKNVGEKYEASAPGWKGEKTTAMWSQPNGHFYRLAKRRRESTVEYTLEHHPAPGQDPVKYRVRNGRSIKIIDQNGNPTIFEDPKMRREINRQALSILLSVSEASDNQFLRDYFKNTYNGSIIGNYLMSHLAVLSGDGELPAIDDAAEEEAAIMFDMELFEAQQEAAKMRGDSRIIQSQKPALNVRSKIKTKADELRKSGGWINIVTEDIDHQYDDVIKSHLADNA